MRQVDHGAKIRQSPKVLTSLGSFSCETWCKFLYVRIRRINVFYVVPGQPCYWITSASAIVMLNLPGLDNCGTEYVPPATEVSLNDRNHPCGWFVIA
jgi:hypothetical protein